MKCFFGKLSSLVNLGVASLLLAGCVSSPGWIPSSGANAAKIEAAANNQGYPGIQVVEVGDAVARRLLASQKLVLFSETLMAGTHPGDVIGAGDIVEVSIWETPPAMLFGSVTVDPRLGVPTTRINAFPEQMVSSDGTINIPFAGQVPAAGRTAPQIEAEIVRRLQRKAHQPQVMVRVVRNNSANVTVVGEVGTSSRMPLSARGERLLDALAAAGGSRQPINKTTLQITRGSQVQALPLDTIIRDPRQNIQLQPGDVITALHQPLSYTVLGATGKNEEVNFEAQGISLAQALARAGGLQDARADAKGVFLFRFESPAVLGLQTQASTTTPDGKIPVIYRVNLHDPAMFFVAQSFPVQNKDVLYVSNAPAAELQKFLNIIVSTVYPIANIVNMTR
jgi:polysaccharide biosynthesis/export protein